LKCTTKELIDQENILDAKKTQENENLGGLTTSFIGCVPKNKKMSVNSKHA